MNDIKLTHLRSEFNLPFSPNGYSFGRIMNSIVESQEKIINEILKKILDREPEKEDYKQLARIYHYKDPMNYELFFRGVHLGTVVYNFPDPMISGKDFLKIDFIPKY